MSNEYPPNPNGVQQNPYQAPPQEQQGGMPPYPPYMQPPLQGLGGWLACFQVYMYYVLIAFFFTIPSYIFLMWMHNNPEEFESAMPGMTNQLFAIYGERFTLVMIIGIILASISLVWMLVNLIFFYQRKKFLPRLMIAYFIFELAGTVVTMLIIPDVGVFTTFSTILGVALAVAWIFYFMRSVRVKNTFVR
ncbi:hypothetical protein PTI45_03882 [Paenibacillus nuruki]|uniref:DUF2569 domain-containing protein n=1 Tax=Paenibacillus nuruki TaxID=1886670 RepID=A0A1E3L1F1_9BACL|nr:MULTISPECIES: DUF2569 family protein [Paenibacillus]ODP26780.1 hypothetical protein PTI45_03882 [Paenibacillus nuruki]TKJ90584.1 DUF2569 domain-containing protein [Paenibacillus sp. CFBP13512]